MHWIFEANEAVAKGTPRAADIYKLIDSKGGD